VFHYRGPLKANGSPSHKLDLRRWFHQQLARLWPQKPLVESKSWLQPQTATDYCFLRPRGAFTFVPLVTAEANTVAELDVALIRPEAPGNLITQGGDIDNRLKTLFDALSMPPHANALPIGVTPSSDETPFFCLLEDDNLVISVAVRTEQLLERVSDPSTVEVTINVRTRVTRRTMGNGPFG
jgi:hypothetical protein